MERIEDGFIMSDELTVRGPEITFQKKDREWKVTGRYQIEDARRTNQKPHKIGNYIRCYPIAVDGPGNIVYCSTRGTQRTRSALPSWHLPHRVLPEVP